MIKRDKKWVKKRITYGIWTQTDSRAHHRSKLVNSPIEYNLIDAIQCHIRLVYNFCLTQVQFCYRNWHRTNIYSMVPMVNTLNCLRWIDDHRSSSVVMRPVFSCRIQSSTYSNCRWWIDKHNRVLVLLLIRNILRTCMWNQLRRQHWCFSNNIQKIRIKHNIFLFKS